MNDLIRVGIVSSVNADNYTARVLFEDQDNAVSNDLKIIVPQSSKGKHYWLPSVNDQVLCIFLPNGKETGFIIGTMYSETDNTPVQDANKSGVWFDDNTYIEYESQTSTLTIKSDKPIKIVGDLYVDGIIQQGGGNT